MLTGNFLDQPVMHRMLGKPNPLDFQVAQSVSTNYFMVSSHHDLTSQQVEYLGESLRTISSQLSI